MSPATLYREGTDLDDLLTDLDQQYPGRVRVVEIAHPREGGVLGFFAKQRVGVHYRLLGAEVSEEASTEPDPASRLVRDSSARYDVSSDEDAVPTQRRSAYAEIQAHAEAAAARLAAELSETPDSGFTPVAPPPRIDPTPSQVPPDTTPVPSDAAPQPGPSVQQLITWPTGERRRPRAVPVFRPIDTAASGVAAEPAASPEDPAPATGTAAPSTSAADRPASPRTGRLNWPLASAATRAALTSTAREETSYVAAPAQSAPASQTLTPLARRLVAAGVAEHRIPADADQAFAAVQQIVEALPEAPEVPTERGSVLVIAGRGSEATATADALVASSGGAITEVWGYGCVGDRNPDRIMTSAADAAEITATLRDRARGAIVIVVATDASRTCASEVIEAIGADAVWAVVEATVKTADAAAALRRLGTVDAVVVTGAGETTTPATVWDLDRPVALIDGRPATPSAWAALLMGALMDQTCSGSRP